MKDIKLNLFLLLLFCSLLFSGCSNHSESKEMQSPLADQVAAESETASVDEKDFKFDSNRRPPNPKSQIPDLKIIKTANITYKIENPEMVLKSLKKDIEKVNGYILSENLDKSNVWNKINVVIKIPNSNFEKSIDFLNFKNGYLEKKEIFSEDVSEEFYDTESRIKAKEAVHKRYIEFLTKARNIKEVLEVEENLRQIEEEMEIAKGRLKYLNNRTIYSTINLELYEELPGQKEPGISFLDKFLKSISSGFDGVIGLFLGIISLWPFLILSFLIYLLIKKWIRNRRLNKSRVV